MLDDSCLKMLYSIYSILIPYSVFTECIYSEHKEKKILWYDYFLIVFCNRYLMAWNSLRKNYVLKKILLKVFPNKSRVSYKEIDLPRNLRLELGWGGRGCFDHLKILAQFPLLEKGDRVKNSDIRCAVLCAYMQYKHFVDVKTQQSQK